MNRFIAFILTFFCLGNLIPIFSIDEYFRFPDQSFRGSVVYEKERSFCFFPFSSKSKNPNYKYLEKGIPSVLLSEIRTLDFVYKEYPKILTIYHSFGKDPQKTLREKIDDENPNRKKKKNPIVDAADLDAVRKGQKSIPQESDPRYLKLKIKQFFDEKPSSEDESYSLSAKWNCNYVLTGEYEISDNELLTKVSLFDEEEAKFFKTSQKTSLIRAYQELSPLGQKLRDSLISIDTNFVDISTGEEVDALVYLDGNYLGKTPLSKRKFPIGKRSLFLFKEGFLPIKDDVYIGKDLPLDKKYTLTKKTLEARLTVDSDGESDVYLGVTYLGKTPLRGVSIPAGLSRLRISRDGFVDAFRPVDASPNQEVSFYVPLRQGDSEIYYKNKQNVFLDYTYNDFAVYSLYGSLLFYASYFYFNYASRQAIAAARPQVELVNGAALVSFYQNNPDQFFVWYAFQNSIISEAESKANNLKSLAGTLPTENRRDRELVAGPMVIGMGVMLVAAATFFWLGLDSETMDIGFLPGDFSGVGVGQGTREGYGYMQFHTRY